MPATYLKCDVTVVRLDSQTYRCSSGFLLVDEPVYTLVTQDQADNLLLALMLLFAVVFVIRELARLIRQ